MKLAILNNNIFTRHILNVLHAEGRLEVETEHSIYQHRDGYVLSSVRFNTAVSVLSININITAKQNSSNGAAACSVVFFGGRDGNSLVLVTNPVR